LEQPKELLRPIAPGSVLGVFSDSKWYRCQVVSYNAKQDTCDVKFVDHGGYTTVPAGQLRQLKPHFLRLPFQAIEVYLAHVNPSTDEVQTDITSEILFHGQISIKLLGHTDDGLPMIQAYYYDGDYINIFTQEIINSCNINTQLTAASSSIQSPCSSEDLSHEDSPTLSHEEYPALSHAEDYPAHGEEHKDDTDLEGYSPLPVAESPDSMHMYPSFPYYSPDMAYVAGPVDPSQAPIAYCYLDGQGLQKIYYVAGPYILPGDTQHINTAASEEVISPQASSDDSSVLSFGWSPEAECDSSEESTTSTEATSEEPSSSTEESDLDSKPYEEWTQADYARYYGM